MSNTSSNLPRLDSPFAQNLSFRSLDNQKRAHGQDAEHHFLSSRLRSSILQQSESNSTIQLVDNNLLNELGVGIKINGGLHQGMGMKQFLQEEETRRALLQPKLQQHQSQQPPSSYSFNPSKTKLSLSPRRGSSSSSGGGGSGGNGSTCGFNQLSTPVEETFSPAMSDSTSTDTEESAGEAESLHPLTPISTSGFGHGIHSTSASNSTSPSSWMPRELNLVRKKSSFQNLPSSSAPGSSSISSPASSTWTNSEDREISIQKDKLAEMEKEREREKSRLGSERVPLAVGLGISSSNKGEEGTIQGKRQVRSGAKKELRLLGNSTSRVESPITSEAQSSLSTSNQRSPSPFSNASSFTYGRSSPQLSKQPRSPIPINPSRPTFATPSTLGHKSGDSNSNSNSNSNESPSSSVDHGKPFPSTPQPTESTERRKRSSFTPSRKRSSTSSHSKSMEGEGHHLGKIPSPSQSPHDPMPSPSGSVASLSSSSSHHHQSSHSNERVKRSSATSSSPKIGASSLPSPGGFSESRKKNKKAIPKLPPMPLVLDSQSGPTFTISSEQSPSSAGHASARARGEEITQPVPTSAKRKSSSGGGTGPKLLPALQPPIQDDYHSFLATSPISSQLKSSNSRSPASMKSEKHLSAASFVSAVSIPTSGFHTPTFNPSVNNDSSDSSSTLNGTSTNQNATLGSDVAGGASIDKSKTLEEEPPATAFFDFEDGENECEKEAGKEGERKVKEKLKEERKKKEEEESRIPLLFRTGGSKPTLKVERDSLRSRTIELEEETEGEEKKLEPNPEALSSMDAAPEEASFESTLKTSSNSGSRSGSQSFNHSAFEFESSPQSPSVQTASIDSHVRSEPIQPSQASSSSPPSPLMKLPPPLNRSTSATSDPASEYSMESASDHGSSRVEEKTEEVVSEKKEKRKEDSKSTAIALDQAMKIVGEKRLEQREILSPLSSSPEEMRPSVLPTSSPQPIPGSLTKSSIQFRTSIFGAPPISASLESEPIDPRSREGSLVTSTLPQISIQSSSPNPLETAFPLRATSSRPMGGSSDASSSNSSRHNSSSNSTRAGTGGSITSATASSLSSHGMKINVNSSKLIVQPPLSPGMPSPHYRSTPLSQRDFSSNKPSNEMRPPASNRPEPAKSNSSSSAAQSVGSRPRSQSQAAFSQAPIRAAMMSLEAPQLDSGLSSHWSSGSESEGESAPRRRRSSSVSGKRSVKDKHLSTSSRTQGMSSAASTKAFFSGLNLRKKSLPFGSDASVSGSSAPSSWAGTPSIAEAPSPMSGGPGIENSNAEWPFPITPSATSSPAPPRSSNDSQSSGRPSSQITRNRSGSLADRFSQMTQSKAKANSLKSKASDVSLSSSIISQGQDSNSIPSLPNTPSGSHARNPSTSTSSRDPSISHERQTSLVGLGISDLSSNPSLNSKSDSKSSGARETTISSPTNAPSRPPRPDDGERAASAFPPTGLRAARALYASKSQQQQSGEEKQIRKSATISDLQKSVRLSHAFKAGVSEGKTNAETTFLARKEARERELGAQARLRESMEAHNPHASTSSDQTPRVSYISLPNSPTSPDAPTLPSRFFSSEDQEGLAEVGKNMFSGIWADLAHGNELDTPSSEKHLSEFSFTDAANGLLPERPVSIKLTPRRIAKAKKAKRIDKYQSKIQHRTSLSDLGKSWVKEHEGEEEMQEMIVETSSSGPSGEYYSAGNFNEEDSSDDGTDYYGSSDGRGGGGSNDEQSGSGAGGSGGSGGNDGWDQNGGGNGEPYGEAREEEEDTDTEESESDSDEVYGTPDPLESSRRESRRPLGPSKLAIAVKAGNETDSSDDVPLGEKISDAAVLQKSLRDRERKEQISKAASALERNSINASSRTLPSNRSNTRYAPRTNADVNGGYKLDAADLTARLLKVQARMNAQGEISSTSGSSRQQSSRGKRYQVAPPSQTAAVSPTAQQGSLSRARSLNASRGGRGGAAPIPPPLPTTGLGMIPNLSGGPLSPPLPQMPGFISQAPNLPSSHQGLPMPQRSVTLPPQSPQVPTIAGMLSSPSAMSSAMAGHSTAARSGSPLLPSSSRAQPTNSPLDPSGAAALSLRSNAMTSSPAMHDLSTAVDNVSLQQQPQQRTRSRSVSRARQVPPINANVAPPVPELIHSHFLSSPPTGSSSGSLASPNNSGLPSVQSLASAVHSEDTPLNSGELATVRRSSSNRRPDPHSLSPVITLTDSRAGSQSHSPLGPPSQRIQHRVYVVTKQRYGTAEVTAGARARDLVLDIMDKEYVPQDGKGGGWVVFDVCPELGLERPMREYEIVSEVSELRATPEDFFLLKRTELAPYLSIRSIPSISPTLAGWVYVQESKGKWSKRWLELRDHQIFHAKNEKGKNEVLICHLSGFDAYLVDVQKIKAPKAHAFALRSQHPISLFEKPDQDYVHYFSLSDPNAHRSWVRACMNARTYCLRQEHAALFKPPESLNRTRTEAVSREEKESGNNSGDSSVNPSGRTSSEMPSRSATRRIASPPGSSDPTLVASIQQQQQQFLSQQQTLANQHSASRPQAQTLIPRDAFAGPFEKGSLLADQAMKAAPLLPSGSNLSRPVNSNPTDFSTHQRTRERLAEEQRRNDLRERSQRARAEGVPLADLAGRRF